MRDELNYFLGNKLNEECGCFGVYNVKEAASLAYFGLHALQHRGQEACGIAVSNHQVIECTKGSGLIQEVFNPSKLESLHGIHAIGHVRYATQGSAQIENVQPIMVRSHTGHFGVVHNGQIVNANEIKEEMEASGSIFQGTSDSEVIVHLIQNEKGTMLEKIKKACNRMEGAFALIILTKDCMYAIRDKNGLRPLSIGSIDEGYCITSETCANDVVNAKFIRDIKPGEVVRIDTKGVQSFQYTDNIQEKMCAMEYIYFARPDSVINGVNVHYSRKIAGKLLAKADHDVEADICIGVPDSSLSAAIGYSEQSGLPYEIGLIKNRYVGRTFIQPSQSLRERGVRMKLSAVSAIVKDKRVIMIDDSIVRGTTSKRIVQLLKDAGAKEVHVRIASSPLVSPCFYGVDTTTYDELISSRLNVNELCEYIHADSLKFLDVEGMKESANHCGLCLACFTKEYPTQLFGLGKVLK